MLTCVISEGRTAVYWAVHYNHAACVEALVRMKADVNMRDECADLASCCVCKVDVECFCRTGQSPLETAKLQRHMECIAALEAAGAT